MKKIFAFMGDEKGISSEVFKLALIVIVIAAILAILANILLGVKDSSTKTTNTVADVTERTAKEFCEGQGGVYNNGTGGCT